MNVLFAPDWRNGVPYQQLLGQALAPLDVRVGYLAHYRRGFPLARLVRAWRRQHPCDLLHLHWPEAYYPKKSDGLDWFRFARFPLDLWLATRGLPLAITAHNLRAHNRRDLFANTNTRVAFQMAKVVFAHSTHGVKTLCEEYAVPRQKVCQIENGDLSTVLGPALPREDARRRLKLGTQQICLMFGAVEPYKGLEEAIAYWKTARPSCELHIAGKPCDEAYASRVRELSAAAPGVHVHFGWLDDETLRAWLSAADCALFNYVSIFNSGSAPTARSYGLPILLPARLTTVELGEPTLSVIRFQSFQDDFRLRLHQALAQEPGYAAAAGWRERTSWAKLAQVTAAAYRQIFSEEPW